MSRKPIRLIHVTDARNRLAIRRWGLRARFPKEHNYSEDPRCHSQPLGVYGKEIMSRPWSGNRSFPDVWKIDCSGLSRLPDRLVEKSWVILCDIPPERLTLVRKGK